MLPQSQEETLELLARFAERRIDMANEDRHTRPPSLDQAEKYLKWAWGFALVIAACASTIGVALYQLSQQSLEIEKLVFRVDAIRDMQAERSLRFQAIETRIENNRTERQSQLAAINLQIEDLNARKKEHDTMWSMKMMGRSNKEEFMRENQIAAPNIPEK